jgi:pimeloyl-ACP methyl ester carboxylesterase
MVAQELALRYPDRVEALVLGATTAGGPETTLAAPQPLTFFVRAGAMAPEEAEWAAVPYNYGVRTRRHHGERIAEDIAKRVEHQTRSLTYLHQVAAAASHNSASRLGQIQAHTLVVHGEDDVIMPLANGRYLAQAIPNAELKCCGGNLAADRHCAACAGAGHLYLTDEQVQETRHSGAAVQRAWDSTTTTFQSFDTSMLGSTSCGSE